MFEFWIATLTGYFHFRLKAKNGLVILKSQSYTSYSALMKGIESVRKNASIDSRYKRKEAKNGKHHFSLHAGNGHIIGKGYLYESLSGLENGINAVQTIAPTAKLRDLR